ncbi:MAG: hypothetical protein J6386_17160 [Candidatus Synoicihabitans palmerolidicus]|nr:hypothetical protein [Candidatus Synoicihabitans palmerolidicus]
MGMVEGSRRRSTPIRNAGFVSFFNGSGCVSRRNTDSYDSRLRRQKLVKTLVALSVTAMCTWFVMESAQAISTF